MKKIIILFAFIIALIIGYNSREVEKKSVPQNPIPFRSVKEDVNPGLPEAKSLEVESNSPLEINDLPVDAAESLEKLFEENPKEVTDYQLELYARQVKYLIESNEMNRDEVLELALRINGLQSEEIKYDIFEYLYESGLLNEADIQNILSQQDN